MKAIRNFAIIAHIDHGKSTLADRFLEITNTVPKEKLIPQYLDRLSLEREKGITIKMQPVTMEYKGYFLNLIDTPGHVDFSYEVSRALAAVEGAILLVDGTQGIQAQTVANFELAKKHDLKIIPAINKIDLEIKNLDDLMLEIYELTGEEDIYLISAKTGKGVEELLKAVIEKIPPPKALMDKYTCVSLGSSPEATQPSLPAGRQGLHSPTASAGTSLGKTHHEFEAIRNEITQTDADIGDSSRSIALVFDSHFDPYKGIIAHVRVFEGKFKKNDYAYLKQKNYKFKILEVGIFKPELYEKDFLEEGMIGYIATGIKDPGILRIGETIVLDLNVPALPGYEEALPNVFANVFPNDEKKYEIFKENILKLHLNDPALYLQPCFHPVFGRGFTIGTLGLLHLEIFEERLKREFGTEIFLSSPSVKYLVKLKNKDFIEIKNPQELTDDLQIEEIHEPIAEAEIYTPPEFLEAISLLIKDHRGEIDDVLYEQSILKIKAQLPLEEIIFGFFDELKSASSGYASLKWSFAGYKKGDLVKLDILIAEEKEPSLSRIVPREKAEKIGRKILLKLKELLPRQEFPIKLQAAINKRIIARETIPAIYRDIAGWLYGGDRTRKMKLWQKQKKGKKKLEKIFKGKIKVPSSVLKEILKTK